MSVPLIDHLAHKLEHRSARSILEERSVVSESGSDIRIDKPYTGLAVAECSSLENKGWFIAKQILSIGGIVDAPPSRAAMPREQVHLINMASYDFLGLGSHYDVVRAAKEVMDRFGVGAGTSQSSDPVLNLEDDVNRFTGSKAALATGSRQDAWFSLLGAIVDDRDTIYIRAGGDPVLRAAAQASGAQVIDHGPRSMTSAGSAPRDPRFTVVIADSVDLESGTVNSLQPVMEFAESHKALVVIDETGGLGVRGPWGRGVIEEQGLWERVPVIVSGFGCGLGASAGAIIAGNREVVEAVRQARTGHTYTDQLSPGSAAAVSRAIVLAMQDPALRDRLALNIGRFSERVAAGGVALADSDYPIQSSVIPRSDRAAGFAEIARAKGISMPSPATTRSGDLRLRFMISAAHTPEQIDMAASAVVEVFDELNGTP